MDLPDKDFLQYKGLDWGPAHSALLQTLLLMGGSGNTDLNMDTNPSSLSSATRVDSKLFWCCTGVSDGKIHWTDFEEILNVF